MIYSLTIPGEPQGKERARYGNGRTYTPKKTVAYEERIKNLFINKWGKPMLEGEVQVSIIAYYTIPKSYSKKKKELAFQGLIKPIKKPDLDNIAKVVLDSLNKIAYKDDNQVVRLLLDKDYSNEPRVEVELEDMNG